MEKVAGNRVMAATLFTLAGTFLTIVIGPLLGVWIKSWYDKQTQKAQALVTLDAEKKAAALDNVTLGEKDAVENQSIDAQARARDEVLKAWEAQSLAENKKPTDDAPPGTSIVNNKSLP